MLPSNLGHIFDGPLHRAPASTAVIQDGTFLTFEGLDARCNQVANGLSSLGISSGTRVALMFDNDHRYFEALFGPMRLGAVSVPLNTKTADDALTYVLQDCGATVLIASPRMAERARRVGASLPALQHVITDGEGEGRFVPYEAFFRSQPSRCERRAVDPDGVCMQPYTSGSTGKPKGVLLSHAGQLWNANVARHALHADETERALICLPLFHKNAMACAAKPFLLGGGSLVILPGFDPIAVIRAIELYQVTYLTGVPAMYKLILAETAALATSDYSSLRYAICSSAEVPEDLLAAFKRVFGVPLAEMYGLTEGGPLPLINARWGFKKRGSCGMAIPGCDVRLVAQDKTTEVGVDEVGELLTRNPGIAKGYWKLAEVTARKFRGGWLHTGDLFRRDRDGFYFFVGREDDMINVAGENVYPKEIEDVLITHPQIRDVCVVPSRHDLKGHVPVAFVVAQAGLTEEAIKTFFLERGAAYAHPRRVHFLEALPLTTTGKPDRAALRARLAELQEAIDAR